MNRLVRQMSFFGIAMNLSAFSLSTATRWWCRRAVLALCVAAAVWSGACAPPADFEDWGAHDRSSSALVGDNGIGINGIGINGIGINGIGINGIGINGLSDNGIGINGIAINGIGINGIGINGIGINGLDVAGVTASGEDLGPQQAEALDELLTYLIECALPEGEEVSITGAGGRPRMVAGLFGLAPEWRTGALTQAGERKVSACLAARANHLERSVSISLRHPEVETTAVEAELYTTHEGAFWGSFFGEDPGIHACRVQGGGLSGRVCAESEDCGFTFVGDCEEVCESYDPVNGYSNCGATGATEVVNTFLSLGSQITFSGRSMCRLDQDGTLACWGDNRYGQLGDGTTQDRSEPVVVSALADVVEVAIRDHACARQRDGSLWCWGRNDHGQVGDGTRRARHEPVRVAVDVATFAIGRAHTCAVGTDGGVRCWGRNGRGELGLGSRGRSHRHPSAVAGLDQAVARLASSATARHTCALEVDGSVRCWGANHAGQLGDGTRRSRSEPASVAVDVAGAPFGGVTNLCTARRYTCARKIDGTLWCWGEDFSRRPQQVAEGVAPEGLACAPRHACYVAEDSTVWCFGDNRFGQLGFDTGGMPRSAPGQVPGLGGVSFVNASRTMTCATRQDGSLWCWGTEPRAGAPLFAEPLSLAPGEIEL